MEDVAPPSPGPGHRLVFHSALNAAGQGIPVAVAAFAVPILVGRLGVERFGLLTLAWQVVGYASLFDFGLGRALTQLVAERRHATDDESLASTVWSVLIGMAGVGVMGGLVAFAAAPWIVERALRISPSLSADALLAFRILALGVPVVVVTTGVRGILEAMERFDLVNAVRVPTGISTFLGPVLVLPFTQSLTAAVVVLVIARLGGLIVQAIMVRAVFPSMRSRPIFAPRALRPVAHFGAWMTVSNVLSPLMSSADRFFIGAMLSASVVAYYTAPYEMVTRIMSLVAVAVATSIFPAFARWQQGAEVRTLFSHGLRLASVVLVPAMLGIALFASPILTLWLGADFAHRSATILRLLALGVIANGLAQVPFAYIQARGRADLTAKVHIAEVPAYLIMILYLIRARGIDGAAIAWTIRMAADMVLMFIVARRLMASNSGSIPATELA